jgi:hypothetical protein
VDPIASIKQSAETYSFTLEQDGFTFDYKKFASVISSCNQQNNYDHRFTQVNTSGRLATNTVFVIQQGPFYYQQNEVIIKQIFCLDHDP